MKPLRTWDTRCLLNLRKTGPGFVERSTGAGLLRDGRLKTAVVGKQKSN